MAVIIDGKKLAEKIYAEVALETAKLPRRPCLAAVLVGDDPASHIYVRNKEGDCKKCGIESRRYDLPADTPQERLLALIDELNHDDSVDGILVQLPLPKQIDENAVIQAISPDKDVDAFHPLNVGKMVTGEPVFWPCTPAGIMEMFREYGISLDGKNCVVVGRSNIVGKPVANLLFQKAAGGNATVTVCHRHTRDLPSFTRQADILVAAAGSPGAITGDMVKPGAVVIDVGVNRVADPTAPRGYRLKGDVVFDEVKEVASMITPVPGGVGPMTITMLLYNTVLSAKLSSQKA